LKREVKPKQGADEKEKVELNKYIKVIYKRAEAVKCLRRKSKFRSREDLKLLVFRLERKMSKTSGIHTTMRSLMSWIEVFNSRRIRCERCCKVALALDASSALGGDETSIGLTASVSSVLLELFVLLHAKVAT
jgi:hypothetical protein